MHVKPVLQSPEPFLQPYFLLREREHMVIYNVGNKKMCNFIFNLFFDGNMGGWATSIFAW